MRITSKGQVTIPAEIRERAGLLPQTEVEFEFDGKVVRIVRAKAGKRDGPRRSPCRPSTGPWRCRNEHRCHYGADARRLNDGRID